jgi:glycolate oxidase FAD binding subunit
MKAAAESTVLRELEALCGAEHAAAGGEAVDGVAPACTVTPGSEEEVAAVLRLASERGLAVVPAGGGTKLHIGNVPARVDIVLRTSRLTEVEHFDPGDLTLGIGAGQTLAAVDALLAGHKLLLPLDPPQAPAATVGGVMATAGHGPLRHAYGGVRDFCIGVRFVSGDGKAARGGGRVVKNVAGYDLMKLLIGSYGTLGVITGASFKLFPRPRQTRTFVAPFPGAGEALAFRDVVLRSALTPLCLELASPRAVEFLREAPLAGRENAWLVLLRAAGSDAVLARYRKELGAAGHAELEGEAEAQLWRRAADFPHSVAAAHQNAMLVSVFVPPAEVDRALEAAERAALDNNFFCAAAGRAGAGALAVAMMPLPVDPPAAMQYAAAASSLRAALSRDSSAVVLRCPREAKAHFSLWGTSLTDLDAMRAVRRALDPASVLNPGRFLIP